MPSSAILAAAVIAWICAAILVFAAAQKPRIGALVERAIIATALAIFGTVYGLIATNTDFGLGLLDNEAAKTVVRSGVVVIVGFLPLIWVVLWATGRLGTSDDTATLGRIEAALERNTEISQQASDHADAAYHEANNVNEKLAAQGDALVMQGEDRAAALERTQHIETTVDETADKVSDIHDVTVGGK